MQKQAMYGQLRWVDLIIQAAQVLSPLCHIVSIFIGASPLFPPLAFSSTIRGRKKAQGARLIEGENLVALKAPCAGGGEWGHKHGEPLVSRGEVHHSPLRLEAK